MNGIVSGTTSNKASPSRVRLTSILITSGAGGGAVLRINDGMEVSSAEEILVNGIASQTVQFNFKGIFFDNGFTVEPDSNTAFYLVEYDTL